MLNKNINELTTRDVTSNLRSLGKTVEYPDTPDVSILETFDAPQGCFTVEFIQEHNEFTSMCPVTGQPDFATFSILYTPSDKCIESKSLKIYLASFRNTAGFGEFLTNRIADDLQQVLQAIELVVTGDFSPRGGIRWITKAYRKSATEGGKNL